MGKLIVFWSDYHGHSRVSSSMLAVAQLLAGLGNSVCVTHTQPGMSDLEGMLNFRISEEEEESIYTAAGLNALILDFKGVFISKEAVSRATIKPIKHKKFYLLPGLSNESVNEEEEARIVEYVLKNEVREAYDYLFVELASGTRKALTNNLLKEADVVVPCLSQNRGKVNGYLHNPLEKRVAELDKKKIVLCFGDYDRNIKSVDYRNYRKYAASAFCVPHNSEFADAISRGDVGGFFLKNELTLEKAEKTDEAYIFLNETMRGVDAIKKITEATK